MRDHIERILSELSIEEIELFAKEHSEEQFYGFGYDVNAVYGEVILCFHSLQALDHIANNVSEVERSNRKAFAEISARLREKRSEFLTEPETDAESEFDDDPEKRRGEKKWDFGSWLYHGSDGRVGHLNQAVWDEKWTPIADELDSLYLSDEYEDREDEFCQEFIESVYRVLLLVQKSGVLDKLPQTDDFKCLIMDHDQSEEEAWSMMSNMKEKFAKQSL